MGSITPAQAALFAALATMLLAAYQLIDNAALLASSPGLVVLGSTVPGLIWTGFFFTVYKIRSSARIAACITLVFAVILEAVVTYIRFQQSVSYWTPFGNALSLSGWLLRAGWVVFLISLANDSDHAPDRRTRRIALVLAILSAPSALSTAYQLWNNGIGLLLDDIPRQALVRVLITPAIRTIYWLSQILFLWTAWGNPEAKKSADATSLRFAP